jgi:hypothetical protein
MDVTDLEEPMATSTTAVRASRPATGWLAGGVALAVVTAAPFSWGDATEDHPLRRFFVTLAMVAIFTAIVAGFAVPRARRRATHGRTALILAVLGLLLVPAYWICVTPVLAGGAIALGRDRGRRGRVAVVIATSATLAFLVFGLVDMFVL